ncbi:hypothetical protein BURMUCGD1_4422 [Burkholderia multivorans CGD1]|nr:hypothetical protein BURMUCGD1_4422 [Burkholderia multivorans CGD1]
MGAVRLLPASPWLFRPRFLARTHFSRLFPSRFDSNARADPIDQGRSTIRGFPLFLESTIRENWKGINALIVALPRFRCSENQYIRRITRSFPATACESFLIASRGEARGIRFRPTRQLQYVHIRFARNVCSAGLSPHR